MDNRIMDMGDKMNTDHAGEHVAGPTRQAQEESRKNAFFRAFTPNSEGSPTRLSENHGKDRNR